MESRSLAIGFGAIGATLSTMVRAGVLAPLRPDKYLRMAAAAGMSVERPGATTVDEAAR
jgi:hypothetical protein